MLGYDERCGPHRGRFHIDGVTRHQ
ncbi:hypothetical protein LNQ03_17350 [Klebsiella pneumoniae subsp. pneumoniae]|nr:hypothetical protein [Klebsiella pneumoniae subsp. pneumoniae]